jgi:adenine phosphoribosyltransferase
MKGSQMRNDLNEHVAVVPDFPKQGVSFKDVSPLLRYWFKETIDAMLDTITPEEMEKIDAFAGLEARGLSLAAAAAAMTGKGFIPVRKKGKLPNPAKSKSYALEYGMAEIEMQSGEGNVFLIDDVLATGGTLKAAADLCEDVGYKVIGMGVLVNLTFLNNFKWKGMPCRSVLNYDATGNLVPKPY